MSVFQLCQQGALKKVNLDQSLLVVTTTFFVCYFVVFLHFGDKGTQILAQSYNQQTPVRTVQIKEGPPR